MFSSTYPTSQHADAKVFNHAVPPPTFSSAYQSPAWRFEGGEGVGYTHSNCYYHCHSQQESGYSYNNTYQRESYANHNYPPWLYKSQDYGYDHYISPSPQYVHPPADNFPSPTPPPPHYQQPPASNSEPPDPPDVMDTLISMLRRLEARIDASEQRWSMAQAHHRLSRSLSSSSWVLPPAWAEPEEVIGSGLAKARDVIWGKDEPNEVNQESWSIASYAGDEAVEVLEVKEEPDVGLVEGEKNGLSGDDRALVLSGRSNLISEDTSEFKSHVAKEESSNSVMAKTKVNEELSFNMENKRVILVQEAEKQLEEKRKALESLKTEERKVALYKDFDFMHVVGNKNEEEIDFVLLDSSTVDKENKKKIREKRDSGDALKTKSRVYSKRREEMKECLKKIHADFRRPDRGFVGRWCRERKHSLPNHVPHSLTFEAPCVLQIHRVIMDKRREALYFSRLFLWRPIGQGKSMLIVRFGNTRKPLFLSKLPSRLYLCQLASEIPEQGMGFRSSPIEILSKKTIPTRKLYINLRMPDTWVAEYRRWLDNGGCLEDIQVFLAGKIMSKRRSSVMLLFYDLHGGGSNSKVQVVSVVGSYELADAAWPKLYTLVKSGDGCVIGI